MEAVSIAIGLIVAAASEIHIGHFIFAVQSQIYLSLSLSLDLYLIGPTGRSIAQVQAEPKRRRCRASQSGKLHATQLTFETTTPL